MEYEHEKGLYEQNSTKFERDRGLFEYNSMIY